MIDVPRRLRRAILLNDLTLVQRIIRNNPYYLRNPDFADKSNTSLHLAATHGFLEIAEFLIESGHEDEGISRNNDWDTPLMLAAAAGKGDVGLLLMKRFPECLAWTNRLGMDALMLAARSSTPLPLLTALISNNPSILSTRDIDGNTALHHASAAGEHMSLRLLLQYGANPMATNNFSWTSVHYSANNAVEAYFKSLIMDMEKKRVEGQRGIRERERQKHGGVRLVTNDEAMGRVSGERQRAKDDAAVAGLPQPGMPGNWSPVQQRRAMTPTETRAGWFNSDGNRARAHSGD
ncbi:ankyrin [Delitschia confertaspora ATCC 74209]|uniref:Ankyrin n=1 Tax=Delitschia confertaspora ATCC 74209 TaxID=1513339 RepID=A0A9P4JAQ6_9PLEO|nr:ankyrin [Delitschia confertaspora ATCC 74209]